jgi:2-amino-1-hydroxyethylphosphonate dioxygenase (glycine-forming)
MSLQSIEEKVNLVFSLFDKFGSQDYIGEPVSQTEHMIQAAMQAEKDGQSDEVILASLLHDIGHLVIFDHQEEQQCDKTVTNNTTNNNNPNNNKSNITTMGKVGVKNHEKVGADYLRKLAVPYPIPELVEGHVQAKRYLTCINPEYHGCLSSASRQSLQFQGGPMTPLQSIVFKKNPLFQKFLDMRRYDDAAKETNVTLTDLQYYREKLIKLLQQK